MRLHSECLAGDVFGSARCDCGPQLCEAVERIADRGGVLLYLRQEGRDIGLMTSSTLTPSRARVSTPTRPARPSASPKGLPEGARGYTAAPQMLAALGGFELDLLSNNPDKAAQLRTLVLTVTQHVPTGVFTTAHHVRYLRTKVVRTRHALPLTELTAYAHRAMAQPCDPRDAARDQADGLRRRRAGRRFPGASGRCEPEAVLGKSQVAVSQLGPPAVAKASAADRADG
ncbi:hypothetical protein ABZV67_39605 [Streptomyces sp. NPDC005065]|uniref:hypothetical protein n=1 Tax=Streptomyces sp. NPDC005065 TaxID=3154461 RepID=UPI0033AE2D55